MRFALAASHIAIFLDAVRESPSPFDEYSEAIVTPRLTDGVDGLRNWAMDIRRVLPERPSTTC